MDSSSTLTHRIVHQFAGPSEVDLDPAAFETQFLELCDAWIAANPVHSTALSAASLRLAAAKVLVKQTQRTLLSPSLQGARVAGILLVLFVHEGLQGQKKEAKDAAAGNEPRLPSEPQILGVGMSEFYQLLKETVAHSQLTREDVLAAVIDVDLDGRTCSLCAQSNQLSKSLFGHPSSSSSDAGTQKNHKPPRLGPSLRALWAARPAADLAIRWHFWMIVVNGAFLSAWPSVQVLSGPPSWLTASWRSIAVSISTTIVVASLAVVFPTGLDSKAGARFVWPGALMNGLGQALTLVAGLFQSPHPNGHCQAVYGLLAFGIVFKDVQSCYLTWHARYSWRLMRLHFVVDGVLFILADVALRYLGPPVAYPPGNVMFEYTISRAIVMVLIGITFSERTRRRLRGLSSFILREPVIVSMVQSLDDANRYPVAESAHIDELVATMQWAMQWDRERVEKLVRRQLNRRYVRHSIILTLTVFGWFFVVEQLKLFRLDGGLFSEQAISEQVRALLFGATFACIATAIALLVTANFPSDLDSAAGRLFLLPLTIICAVFTSYFAWRSYMDDGVAVQVNDPCRRVHAILCICSPLVWSSLMVRCAAGRMTWSHARVVLLLDGLTFILAALAMRHFGPPPFYLPHNVSLPEAVVRSAITPLIAACLTPSLRQYVAKMANQSGLNHVCVNLMQLGHARGGKGAQPGEDSASSMDDDSLISSMTD